jgi:hypothetical protein
MPDQDPNASEQPKQQNDASDEASVPCFVYPDTNILLHFRSIDELPFADIVGARTPITVALMPTVIDELDQQKVKHPNPDLRARAKKVITRLREWRKKGSPLPNGVLLAFRVKRHGKDLRDLGLDASISDDRFLAEILSEREERSGRHVLLTADYGPELRAESFQLEVLAPPEALRLAVPDTTEKELKRTKAELQRMQTRQPVLAVRFADGNTRHELVVRRPAPLSDADVLRMVEQEQRRRTMVVPAQPGGTDIAGLMASLSRSPLEPSAGAIQAYNEEVRQFLPKYEESLRYSWFADQELFARSVEINLELRNDGNVTASTVRIKIDAPADIKLAEDEPEGHRAPEPPSRPRSPLDPLGTMLPESVLRGFQPRPQPNVRGPSLTDDEHPAIVFSIEKALHKQPYNLKPFFLIYPTIEAIRSITLAVSVLSDELLEWATSELHVVVNIDDAAAEKPQLPGRSES